MRIRGLLVLFVGAACLLLFGCVRTSSNIPFLVSESPMPDIPLGERGKGFTCTGIAVDEKENAFYIGNCGKTLPEDEAFHATIVKVSKDDFHYIEEIKLYERYPELSDVQGVAIDTSDDTIFFCSPAEDKIWHITKSGEDRGEFYASRPTGIAYDSRTDTLWVLTDRRLMQLDKSGKVICSIRVALRGQDQLFLDQAKNTMYLTAGNNYSGENYVYRVRLSSKRVSLAYLLKDSYAVEGIYLEGNSMYILNDGYYHAAKKPVNQVNQYDLTRLMSQTEYEKDAQNNNAKGLR